MGVRVYGSYYSDAGRDQLKRWKIKAFKVDFSDVDSSEAGFFKSNTLIVTVPPSKGGKELYAQYLEKILVFARDNGTKKVIFTSSTAVYPESSTPEDSPIQEHSSRGNNLFAAEAAVKKIFGNAATIVRLGGLIGPQRHPARFLSGKLDVAGANVPVNFLSLEDGVRMLADLVNDGRTGRTFNLVCPPHPSKKEYYGLACKLKGLPAPEFDPTKAEEGYKLVDGSLITRETSIEYLTTDWNLYLNSLK